MSFVYFVSSDKIGCQDPELGRLLMHSFFTKLLEAAEKPSHILFVERGVKLLAESSPIINSSKILEDEYGVAILACITCLNYYDLKDNIQVGQICGMADIISAMHDSDKVIHI